MKNNNIKNIQKIVWVKRKIKSSFWKNEYNCEKAYFLGGNLKNYIIVDENGREESWALVRYLSDGAIEEVRSCMIFV